MMHMEEIRKIIHIDMDAFYASIEQRDNKNLKGKPVIVGGDPHSRGVVATCSYEARKYGIHSAMPSNVAYKRCPYAHFIWPRFDVYHKVSKQIRDIFYRNNVSIAEQARDILCIYGNEINSERGQWLDVVSHYKDGFVNRLRFASSKKMRYINKNMSMKIRLSILMGNR